MAQDNLPLGGGSLGGGSTGLPGEYLPGEVIELESLIYDFIELPEDLAVQWQKGLK
jgi:hypothetical protein